MSTEFEPRPAIRLVGNSDALGARFEPPLDESNLFDAILLNCPVKSIDRKEDGTIEGITYHHTMYGVKEPNVKTEFIENYLAVADSLGRVIVGRGTADQAAASLETANSSLNSL